MAEQNDHRDSSSLTRGGLRSRTDDRRLRNARPLRIIDATGLILGLCVREASRVEGTRLRPMRRLTVASSDAPRVRQILAWPRALTLKQLSRSGTGT